MAEEGVTVEFFSRAKLEDRSFEEKMQEIMDKVRESAVLVLEEGWNAEQKRKFIQKTMEEADEEFPGVEFMGLDPSDSRLERAKSFVFDTVLGQDYRSGLTIVGNSRVMEKMKEEKHSISFLAKLEEDE
jgi:Uncharacterized protein conserved in archaea